VNTAVSYDAANRVVTMADSVSVHNNFPPGWTTTPLATQVYSYDDASRVTAETDAEGTASFTYDNANELTAVTGSRTESYSYDLNGNRTGTGYHTTVMNEMSTSPGNTYTYDNAGNMISDNNGTTITTYSYDYENRLTTVTTGGTVVATYTYNALGQRIGVKDSGTQTWTVYDGPSADATPYADFNGSGSMTVRYLFGPTVVNGAVMTGILARTSSGGTTAWYLTDKLGSVRDIVSTTGTELDHIVYDSFGNIVTETNVSNGDRFKFAGMQYDATTGQYYDHARYYDDAIGRFMRQDPKSFAAGDADLLRYVGNSPTNMTDFSGEGNVYSPSDFLGPPMNIFGTQTNVPGNVGTPVASVEGGGPNAAVTANFTIGNLQGSIPLSPPGVGGLNGHISTPVGGVVEGPNGMKYIADLGNGASISIGPPDVEPPEEAPDLRIHDFGPYFGQPVQYLNPWFGWRPDPRPEVTAELPMDLPFYIPSDPGGGSGDPVSALVGLGGALGGLGGGSGGLPSVPVEVPPGLLAPPSLPGPGGIAGPSSSDPISPTQPVPEPSTLEMMAAGALFILWWMLG
jgi:RHS repeat-associated protein